MDKGGSPEAMGDTLSQRQGQRLSVAGAGVKVGVISHFSAGKQKRLGAETTKPLFFLARPERFELPTPRFVASGRAARQAQRQAH
jgi:hypothetical protein